MSAGGPRPFWVRWFWSGARGWNLCEMTDGGDPYLVDYEIIASTSLLDNLKGRVSKQLLAEGLRNGQADFVTWPVRAKNDVS